MSEHVIRDHFATLAADTARKTAPLFHAKGWTWGPNDEHPDEADIAVRLMGLMHNALRMDEGSSSTGRFSVSHYREDGAEVLAISLDLGDVTDE